MECEAERAFIVNNVIAFCKEINPGAIPQLAKDSAMQYDFQRVPLASVSAYKARQALLACGGCCRRRLHAAMSTLTRCSIVLTGSYLAGKVIKGRLRELLGPLFEYREAW